MPGCLDCGTEVLAAGTPGRPRKYCTGCRPRKRPLAPQLEVEAACVQCETCFHTRNPATAKYCSDACKWLAKKRRDGVPCAICGEPTAWTQDQAGRTVAHKVCALQSCGTTASYRRGCRCADCRRAQAAATREYTAQRKAQGRPIPRRPGENRHYHLSDAERLAIYERDSWTCQLCFEAVDRSGHFNEPFAATLDHVIPQSLTLVPDHSPSNLRLAHRICNARRGNRMEEAC